MIRSALIIGSPDPDIPGVYDDMRNYRRFFESPSGGAWYSSEITTLECPSSGQVKAHLAGMKNADYTIVVFAGHGYFSEAKRCTMLELRKGDHIEDYALKVGSPKHTLIVDACRVVAHDLLMKKAMEAALNARFDSANATASRLRFDKAVQECASGLATMYSCSVNETAGDIAGTGGRYSSALLTASKEWADSTYSGVLSVSDAHQRAVAGTVVHSGGRQNPTAEFPRTVPRFPFAVKA